MEGHPAFILLGVCAGLTAGLFGLGGGLVTVPLLVALGAPAAEAVGTSVLVVLVNATAGTVQHARLGNVSFRRAGLMVPGAVLLAPVGSWLADVLPEAGLRGTFSVMLVFMGWLVLNGRSRASGGSQEKSRFLWGSLTGGLAGFLGGLFGIGGGAVLVPLQMLLLGATVQSAVATSLAVMVASMTAALATHASTMQVYWEVGAWLAIGGLVGAPLGARIAHRLSERTLRAGFVLVLIVLAVTMAVQTIQVL